MLENMYTPIQSSKVFEQIAQQIEERILSGELQSGDRLPTERELSQQFHASRTAVREAMKTLAQRGLVDMRPGRGTIVIDGTSQTPDFFIAACYVLRHINSPLKAIPLAQLGIRATPAKTGRGACRTGSSGGYPR